MSLIEIALVLFFVVPILFFSGLFVTLAWAMQEVGENDG